MQTKSFKIILGSALLLTVAIAAVIAVAADSAAVPQRPEGPCDVYAAGGAPCVAAHSSTRALYKDYDGPLYQIMRQSDGKTLDIGVVKPSAGDPGGYADAAAQDEFCKDTYCWVTVLYDQSGKGNHLVQAPRGGFSGPAMGGFNNVPLADMAPTTIMGHKVYGLFVVSGMGLRWNDAHGTAVDDQAEGQYWVISGHHYNSGCCFDYGNAETDSRDDGDGTMETTYFGTQRAWYYGHGTGPWIMTDQENNLVGCVNPDPNDKFCETLKSINWRFVTATADGAPHRWRSMGGNAQGGELEMLYDGGRIINPRSSYDPMRKQGAILLGNGGDNSNGSAGIFYEAAMTAPGTFPTVETNQAVQANVVAARYDVPRLTIGSQEYIDNPGGLQTFSPKSSAHTSVKFVNTTGETIDGLELSLELPRGWKAVVAGSKDKVRRVNYSLAPGQAVVVDFTVTSASKEYNGDLVAVASWNGSRGRDSWRAAQKVRNVQPVKINEFRAADDRGNSTNSFIELYNDSDKEVNISGWTLTHHEMNLPYFSSIRIPSGTSIAPKGFYLMGLSTSGLAVDAAKGDRTIYVRSVKGIRPGDEITVGSGKSAETVKVAGIVAPEEPKAAPAPRMMRGMVAPGTPTTLWQPLPDGPVITIPAGSNNVPVTSTSGFKVGQKMAIGYGSTYPAVSNSTEKYEVVTVTEVGKPGTQAYLSMDAKKGDTNIKVSSTENISVGDKIRLDIDSEGHGIETVTVKAVGTPSVRNTFNGPLLPGEDPGTGLELEEPLKFDHASNMPFSARGTGISFEPATKFDHSSNEPVLALVYAIELESPLKAAHAINDVVMDVNVKDAGYQGEVPADLLFGGPAISASAGNMTLRNAGGLIVDALNYGRVVDPWLGEGYQGVPNKEGNFAPAPVISRPWGAYTPSVQNTPELSTGRYPDGKDSDDNENDFRVQAYGTLLAPVKAGEENIKVSDLHRFSIGQYVVLGNGDEAEAVQIATIGDGGAAQLSEDAKAGSTVLSVRGALSFKVGQAVVLNGEEYKVAAVQGARRYWPGSGPAVPPSDKLTLSSPLRKSAVAGEWIAGSGITLARPVARDHKQGDALTSSEATPGRPNRY